ncbi:MAG: HEAT repeat domain-containing protein [Lachnospiraceae bacterium]|nr:HEAT repeat domain-containing protein [Lachnospiraceae bacterium]
MAKIDKISRYVKKAKTAKLRAIALFDGDISIRLAAIEGLGKLAESEAVENALISMLGDNDPDIRAAASSALGNARSSYACVQLEHYYENEKDEKVLDAARVSLIKMKESAMGNNCMDVSAAATQNPLQSKNPS